MNLALLKASLAVVGDAPGLRACDASELYPAAKAGRPLLRCETAHCRATIALQGAQLLAFQPNGGPELLWMSPLAQFRAGQPIRGGIPLCLPWFGPHPRDPDQPKHGFARLRDWRLTTAGIGADDALSLQFDLDSDAGPACAVPFRATLQIDLHRTLRLRLDVHNRGEVALPLSWAFHSYLAVDDLASTRVRGLSGRVYLDNAASNAELNARTGNGAAADGATPVGDRRRLPQVMQHGDIRFDGEVDRVYTAVGGSQQLCAGRSVEIAGNGCDTVVVWNPGQRLGSGMTDIGPHFGRFVCVERGAAFDDSWSISPGATGSATMTLSQGSAAP